MTEDHTADDAIVICARCRIQPAMDDDYLCADCQAYVDDLGARLRRAARAAPVAPGRPSIPATVATVGEPRR